MTTPTPGAAPQMAAEQGEWTVMDDHHMSFGDCRLGPQIWMPGRRVGFVETQNCGVMKALECAHHIVHCVNTHAQLSKECHFAQSKLSKLGRLIEFADDANEGASDMEVATSASFNEALALEALSQTESERDAALATCADLLAALEAVVKWREGKEGPECLFEEGCEMMRLVRLALAKAKAGAQ